jgi:hypothetical protein
MERMRAPDGFTESMLTVLKLVVFARKNRPSRAIRSWLKDALKRIDDVFARMYEADAQNGQPSIAPYKRVRMLLFQLMYSIRSERMFMEQITPCCSGGSSGCRETEPFVTTRCSASTATDVETMKPALNLPLFGSFPNGGVQILNDRLVDGHPLQYINELIVHLVKCGFRALRFALDIDDMGQERVQRDR